MKKLRRILLGLLIAVVVLLCYNIIGIISAYYRQPELSTATAARIDAAQYRGDSPGPDRALIIDSNEKALYKRVQLIESARERIILSTFTFKSDKSGSIILGSLLSAAERGVDVRVVVDGYSGQLDMEGDKAFYALSSHPNVTVKTYNPISPLKPWKSMGRLHDKYIVVDDGAYMLGGRNTHDGFLGKNEGYQTYDWDMLVCTDSPEESSIKSLLAYFEEVWVSPDCVTFHDSEALGKKTAIKNAAEKIEASAAAYRDAHPELKNEDDLKANTLPTEKITLLSGAVKTGAKEPELFYALAKLMGSAQEDVKIHTPYMIFNDAMYDAFTRLSAGVPVTVMTNAKWNNANVFAAGDYAANKGRLLDTGMHIMEFDGGVSYHGKCMVIDSDISALGSFNMDIRSAYLDTELMLVVDSPEINSDLRRRMETYEKQAGLVIDENTTEYPPGVEAQSGSVWSRGTKKLTHLIFGWTRFLM